MEKNQNNTVLVAGLWETKNGHYRSAPVDARTLDTLNAALEHGGQFLIRKRTSSAIAGAKDPTKTPTAFLEFVPKDAIDSYKNNKSQAGV